MSVLFIFLMISIRFGFNEGDEVAFGSFYFRNIGRGGKVLKNISPSKQRVSCQMKRLSQAVANREAAW